MNESMSKGDGPSPMPHNVFVAWSRDSDHKSIHYLNTEVQGSSTSWPDQACKWCTHFPVQTDKADIQHLKNLKGMKTRVSSRPDGHFPLDLCRRKRFFFPSQQCLVHKYLMTSGEAQPLAALGRQLGHLGSLNKSTKKCTKTRKLDNYLDFTDRCGYVTLNRSYLMFGGLQLQSGQCSNVEQKKTWEADD